jgi:hypothetical protein
MRRDRGALGLFRRVSAYYARHQPHSALELDTVRRRLAVSFKLQATARALARTRAQLPCRSISPNMTPG